MIVVLSELPSLLEKIRGIGCENRSVCTIILVGSASRGELRVRSDQITSDLEFLFVTSNSDRDQENNVRSTLRDLSSEFCIDIDVSFLLRSSLKKVPKRLFFLDLRETGKIIYGIDVINEVRRFDAGDIDLCDLNNILIYRGLSILSADVFSDLGRQNISLNMSYVFTYMMLKRGLYFSSFEERLEFLESQMTKGNRRDQRLKGMKIDSAILSVVKAVRCEAGHRHVPEDAAHRMLAQISKVLVSAARTEPYFSKYEILMRLRLFKGLYAFGVSGLRLSFSFMPRALLMKRLASDISNLQHQPLSPSVAKWYSLLYEKNVL